MPAAAMPAATRLFLAGNAVAMTGNGLVLAFTLIYLHQARGIALPVVGLLLAAGAAAGLLAVTVSGVLLDWLGARRVLTGIILGQAAAQVLLAWAHNAATALPALLLYGATWAPMFPAISTVIARLAPDPATQQRVFAINFTAQNAALANERAAVSILLRRISSSVLLLKSLGGGWDRGQLPQAAAGAHSAATAGDK